MVIASLLIKMYRSLSMSVKCFIGHYPEENSFYVTGKVWLVFYNILIKNYNTPS